MVCDFATDLKPGEILQVGRAKIHLDAKTGQAARLVVRTDRHISVFKFTPKPPNEPKPD